MKQESYQNALNNIQKWRLEKPEWFVWGGIALGLLLYYLVIVLSLNYSVENLQDEIKTDQTQAEWMTKAGQEILRLRQSLPNQTVKTTESTFNLVNQSINTNGWTKIVTDMRQMEQNRVQITFNAIAYKELMAWLETLFTKYRIYVLEATLSKSQPGVVTATFVLEQKTR